MTPSLIVFKLISTALPAYWLWTVVKVRFYDVPRMRAAWKHSRDYQRHREMLLEQGFEKDDHRQWYVDQLQWMSHFGFAIVAMQLLLIWGIPGWADLCSAASGVFGTSVGLWSITFTSRHAYKDALDAETREAIRMSVLHYLADISEKYGASHVGGLVKVVQRDLHQKVQTWLVDDQLESLRLDAFVECVGHAPSPQGKTWGITEEGKAYHGMNDLFSTVKGGL